MGLELKPSSALHYVKQRVHVNNEAELRDGYGDVVGTRTNNPNTTFYSSGIATSRVTMEDILLLNEPGIAFGSGKAVAQALWDQFNEQQLHRSMNFLKINVESTISEFYDELDQNIKNREYFLKIQDVKQKIAELCENEDF